MMNNSPLREVPESDAVARSAYRPRPLTASTMAIPAGKPATMHA